MKKKAFAITQGRLWQAPVCPKCTTHLDGFTGLDGATPAPGSLTVCGYCLEPLTFIAGEGKALRLREATQEDIDALPEEARNIFQAMRRELKKLPVSKPQHSRKA